MDKERKGQNV